MPTGVSFLTVALRWHFKLGYQYLQSGQRDLVVDAQRIHYVSRPRDGNVLSGQVEHKGRVRIVAGVEPGPCTTRHIDLMETETFYVALPPGQAQATFSTSWIGSHVVMTLTTPSGRVIDRTTTTPDVIHDKGAAFETYTILNPEPGDWQVGLFGADVPPGGEEVVFGHTTVPALNSPPVADVNGPYYVDEGGSVTLDGTGSSDPDGDPLTYDWDLDDDGVFETSGPTPVLSAAGRGGPDTQPIVLQVCDPSGECDTANGGVSINNVSPTVTADLTSQTVQYSDYISDVTITATDVSADSMIATTSWSVDGGGLTLGLPDFLALTNNGCSVSTDTNTCTWILEGISDVPAGVYTMRVTVADNDGGQTEVDVTIEVLPEDASIAFDDSNLVAVQVDTPGGDSNAFSLTVYVSEKEPDLPEGGSAPGNIGLADVSMSLVPVGPGSTANPVANAASVVGTDYNGVLQITYNFEDVPVNTYAAEVTVDGGYYTGYAEDVLVIYDPSLGFATGGGWFYWPGTGEKTNFGFTMKYNQKATKVQGSLLLIRHLPNGTIYRVKSNRLHGLAIGQSETPPFGWASFSGKATYREPGWPEPIGNHEFVVYVEDHNEPGVGFDRFWIEVIDKDHNAVIDMSMLSPATDNTVLLGGGNIVVPH